MKFESASTSIIFDIAAEVSENDAYDRFVSYSKDPIFLERTFVRDGKNIA
ncbi:hypothetical protein J0A67_11460 [Algoriphagus aestuariicola]|uniref:Uncharacterized protein n=1 Tax=Algoriphagus aestuariicola TaxID=1852016 RepID=A0ABS3BQB3_9BACT|nr:hypothetical protein [Algoriphagus aestuariicola]MBN7801482.1 hypothetical protein [Algoriphagus aestuariicola]